jgi:uncharacterized repeat protein (TIGR01451 family)
VPQPAGRLHGQLAAATRHHLTLDGQQVADVDELLEPGQLPVEPGEQRLQIEGRAEMGLSASGEQIVHVEQSAELVHTVKDSDEVIEVGSETTYEIRVTNKGTKAATNVRVAALMPTGMAAISGEGPTRAGGDATQVVFEPRELPQFQDQRVLGLEAPKGGRVGREGASQHLGIAAVVFGAGHCEAIAEAVQLLGVKNKDMDAPCEQHVDRQGPARVFFHQLQPGLQRFQTRLHRSHRRSLSRMKIPPLRSPRRSTGSRS